MYFVYTHEHGFESVVFDNKAAALAHGLELKKFVAYRNTTPGVYYISQDQLRRHVTVDLD